MDFVVVLGGRRGGSTLVYGSGDYTRINPAMDEHGEINILLFNGLTAHDGDNQVVPCFLFICGCPPQGPMKFD